MYNNVKKQHCYDYSKLVYNNPPLNSLSSIYTPSSVIDDYADSQVFAQRQENLRQQQTLQRGFIYNDFRKWSGNN